MGDEKDREEREMQRLQDDLLKLSLSWLRVIGEHDEFLPGIAKIYRKMFLEFQAAGFTEEQALMIVAHQGLGGVKVRQG